MSDNLEELWNQARALKQEAHHATDSPTVLSLINDLIDEIELEMPNGGGYDDEDEDDNIIDFDG